MEESLQNNNNISRNNHYIPRMYLKQWALNNQVHVYGLLASDEKVPVWRKRPLARVGSLNNLYVRFSKSGETDDFEHIFDSDFENPAVEPLEKVIAGERMTADDWDKLISYVACQYVRTPVCYIQHQKPLNEICSNAIDSLASNIGENTSFRRTSFQDSRDFDILPIKATVTDIKPDKDHTLVKIEMPAGKSAWLYAIHVLLSKDSEFMKTLKSFKWSVVISDPKIAWPTSDNPVIVYRFDPQSGKVLAQRAIGEQGAMVFFPLSPSKALVGSIKRIFPYRTVLEEKQSVWFKKLIIENAFAEVFSCSEDDTIQAIRPRIVDRDEYNRLMQEFSMWYDKYTEIESPLLLHSDNK